MVNEMVHVESAWLSPSSHLETTILFLAEGFWLVVGVPCLREPAIFIFNLMRGTVLM
jgi:hypothetical protein